MPQKPIRPLKPIKIPRPLKPTKPLRPIRPPNPFKPQPAAPSKELSRETAKILRLKDEIGVRFWDLGQCLIRVHDQAIYAQGGFDSFEQYLGRKGVGLGRTTAYRLMELARNFGREIARKHGKTKLLASIDLAKATPEEDRPIDVLAYQIEVTSTDGKPQFKPFKDASSNEIKRAVQRIKRRQAKKPHLVPMPHQYLKPAWQAEALRSLRAIAPKATLSIQTAKAKGPDPEITLTLSGIPRSKLRIALTRLAQAAPES
ncbi:MAG: hypothetical protein JRF33_22635 [Deltaproteobacteria bacterium]|nr:hypothetical protein [Deltaproteobacteria bacterium]